MRKIKKWRRKIVMRWDIWTQKEEHDTNTHVRVCGRGLWASQAEASDDEIGS